MKREVKIGLFAIIILLCFWAAIRFLKGTDIFSRNHTYYATYAQINGLQSASPILIKGFKVGSVSGIEFDPARNDQVVLRLNINRKYRIPTNSRAMIFSNGLMGGKAIEIELGNASSYLHKGDTLRTAVNKDLMDIAGSELEFFKSKVTTVVGDLTRTLGNLNALLEANTPAFTSTLQHINSVTGNLDELFSAESRNLRNIIEGIDNLTRTLDENTGHLNNIISNVDDFTGSLARMRLDSLTDSMQGTIASLDGMLADIRGGEGTIGQLLDNPALYDSLTAATGRLSVLLADVKANPKRYVHFSLFGGNYDKRKARQQERQQEKLKKKEAREAKRSPDSNDPTESPLDPQAR